MSRRAGLVPALLAATVLTAGCGSTAGQAGGQSSRPVPPSLATSLVTPGGTWAVAVLGGSATEHDNFWQLFVRPAGSGRWRLATPPGVASNGGLVLAGLGGGSVLAGFRPSQDLSYSPLATTHDNGAAWSPGILDAGLEDVPDAIAASPGGSRLLALLASGEAELSVTSGATWRRLAARRALAASAAGSRCGLGTLTAAAFSRSGTPMVAANCTRPGITGIFAYAGGTWHPAGPALPASYAHQDVAVLRLATTASVTTALLVAGTGPAARLLAAQSTGNGARWELSRPLPLNGARLTSASFGPGGTAAIMLNGNRAETLTGPAGSWQALPAPPLGTATLAPGSRGVWDALAAHRTKLNIWQFVPGSRAWAAMQTISVPIQFGSSA